MYSEIFKVLPRYILLMLFDSETFRILSWAKAPTFENGHVDVCADLRHVFSEGRGVI